MVDVTVENFAALRHQIESELHSALFVAIDTEFTSLLTDSSYANEWFDSGNDRYAKLRKNLKDVSICQLGLAICKVPWRNNNQYECAVYNVFLQPPSVLGLDSSTLCQASSLSFLARHNFDFNKWVYSGVPYLSRTEEASLLQQLADMAAGVSAVPLPHSVKDAHRAVLEWSATAARDEVYVVKHERSAGGTEAGGPSTAYLDPGFAPTLLSALHSTTPDLHATVERGVVRVRKVDAAERNQLAKKINSEFYELADGCMDWLTGFSHIMWLISELKVPVVLHNGLLDLMLLYKQFFGPLPYSLESFKRHCHARLPKVHDTKLVSQQLKRLHKEEPHVAECMQDTTLAPLAEALTRRLPLLFKPVLTVPQPNKYGDRECPHEAGYDAYLTAACFLHLSHLHFTCSLPDRNLCRAMEAREHLATLKPFVNKLNVMRAAVLHLNLTGDDETAPRPPWLIVEYTNRFFGLQNFGRSSSVAGKEDNSAAQSEKLKSSVPQASVSRSTPPFHDLDALRSLNSQATVPSTDASDPSKVTWTIDENGFVINKPSVASPSYSTLSPEQSASTPLSNNISYEEISSQFIRNDPPFPPVLKHIATNVRKPLVFPNIDSSKQLESFNPDSVSVLLSRFGSVDVRTWRRNKLLVAAASYDTHFEILRDLKVPGLRVYPYSAIKHSFVARGVLWSGLVASGGLSAYLLYRCVTDVSLLT